MDIDKSSLLVGAVTAIIGGLCGSLFAHGCYWVQKKKEIEMMRKERLLEQAMKVRRLQLFRYFDTPWEWALSEEIDTLKCVFSIYKSSLTVFRFRYKKKLSALFENFSRIELNFQIHDGKQIPPPSYYSQQRIESLQHLIDALM